MKPYPDPNEHLERHVDQAARQYVQLGLQPNDTLTRTLAERVAKEAKESYKQESEQVLSSNIATIERRYRKEMNRIKREGARERLWTCPPIALIFGLSAWSNFAYGNTAGGIICAVGALAFLVMLILGAIFDRPVKERDEHI